MQSKLVVKCNRVLFLAARNQPFQQALRFATSTGRTADPAVHSVEPEEVGATEAIRDEKLRHLQENEPSKQSDAYIPPKSPIESSPKLEHPAVGPRKEPITQQKRRSSKTSATSLPLDDLSCAGVDGSPWPAEQRKYDGRQRMDDEVDDDREYFKHHKASPLSEIELADTRKPITRATDGGTQSSFSIGYERDQMVTWSREQLDTAEDSLYRAAKIFRQNAAEGDPDSPHGRVLRALLDRT